MNDERYAAARLRVIQRNPWLLGFLAAPLVSMIAIFVPARPLGVVMVTTGFVALVVGLLAWGKNLWSRTEEVAVTADRSALRLGARVIPRSRIREGHLVPAHDDKPPRVVIRRRRRLPIEIEVESAGEGKALIGALGLDTSRTVETFRALSPLIEKRPYLAVLMQFLINGSLQLLLRPILHREGFGIAGMLVLLGILSSVLFVLMTTRVLVGADGVMIRWLWRERFVGYREIERIASYAKGKTFSKVNGVKLVLVSGETIRLAISNRREIDDKARILSARIHAAWSARHGAEVESAALVLGREGSGMSAWIRRLRALGAGANADMRTAPIPREQLFRVVEDASIEPTSRAAAAVALGLDLDEEGRNRLRAAAQAMAAPKLRLAIETAASSHAAEDRAVEAALAEIESEDARRRGAFS